jgi:hypothetical protein
MFKRIFPLLLTTVIFLSACGPQGTPTLAPAEVEGTAISSAWTMVAMTQLALPTATPIPPTDIPSPTPPPTFTPLPLPTLDISAAVPTSTKSGDPCNKLLVVSSGARMTRFRLENDTKAPVTLSIFLNKTPFGDCGYRGYNLSITAKDQIDFPQGCYYFFAIINDPKKPAKAFGGGDNICANNSDLWVVRIGRDVINFISP